MTLVKLAPNSNHKKYFESGDSGTINQNDNTIKTKLHLRLLNIIPESTIIQAVFNHKLNKQDPIKLDVLDWDHKITYPIRVKVSSKDKNKMMNSDRPPKTAFSEDDTDGGFWIPIEYLSALKWQVS